MYMQISKTYKNLLEEQKTNNKTIKQEQNTKCVKHITTNI